MGGGMDMRKKGKQARQRGVSASYLGETVVAVLFGRIGIGNRRTDGHGSYIDPDTLATRRWRRFGVDQTR